MNEELEYIGTITGIKGYKGELTVSDVPVGIENLKDNCKVGIGYSSKFVKFYSLQKWKYNKKRSHLILKEIDSEEKAKALGEKGIFVEKNSIYTKEIALTDEIIGCKVFDIHSGEELGKIVDVWYLPGNDVWQMRMSDGLLALPVIDDVIKEVDIENEIIKVNIINGLMSIKEPLKE